MDRLNNVDEPSVTGVLAGQNNMLRGLLDTVAGFEELLAFTSGNPIPPIPTTSAADHGTSVLGRAIENGGLLSEAYDRASSVLVRLRAVLGTPAPIETVTGAQARQGDFRVPGRGRS